MKKYVPLTLLFASLSAHAATCGQIDRQAAQAYQAMEQHACCSDLFDEAKFNAAEARFAQVMQATNDVATWQCRFPEMQNAGIGMSRSADKKLRIFSWRIPTGGSMHEYAHMVQIQDGAGRVRESGFPESGSFGYVERIEQDTLPQHGRVYLMFTHGVGFGRLHGKAVEWFSIKNNRLQPEKLFAAGKRVSSIDYAYEPHSQDKLPENFRHFVYDAKRRQLSFPVVRNTKAFEYGELTGKRIVYRFENGVFVRK
ncbi:hypothetical protein [Neisseria sp.]|uniref:hypothetical protein n=1 Tax=Neisseria sp. TaxID=192066 RepID=UPI0035A035DF